MRKESSNEVFTIEAKKTGDDVRVEIKGKGSDFFFYSAIVETLIAMNKRANEKGSYNCKNGFWLAVMDAVNDSIREAANEKN